MFKALRNIFKNASFSIFGDIAQGLYSYQAISRWDDILDTIGECELLYLNRSYRTTIEIMQDANKTLKKLNFPEANNVVRHGDAVEYIDNNSVSTIKNLMDTYSKDYKHTAILCKDDNELKQAQETLADLNLVVLDENNLSYADNQRIILTVQTAKGLEFDSVILYDYKSYTESENDLKLLYVAKTRALHKLTILNT
jgi:DNA helicase-2/ATP-dependent DNA helicase PcrA